MVKRRKNIKINIPRDLDLLSVIVPAFLAVNKAQLIIGLDLENDILYETILKMIFNEQPALTWYK